MRLKSVLSLDRTLLSLPRRDGGRTRSILTDLVRRHPSAYAWMAFADEWMTVTKNNYYKANTITCTYVSK